MSAYPSASDERRDAMNTGTFALGRLAALAGGLTITLTVAPGAGAAQTGAGWSSLLGCWSPGTMDQMTADPAAERALCILPGTDAVTVELATVVDGAI